VARKPAVAGNFYPSDPDALRADVRNLLAAAEGNGTATIQATAVIAPHAGYQYCGKVAAEVWSRVEVPNRVVVVGPNHTGLGHPAALARQGPFMTPMGPVPLDESFSELLASSCNLIEMDDLAHAEEHSIEVILPFLLARNPDIRVTALCLRTMALSMCENIGACLAAAVRSVGEPVLLVASSDLNHHEPSRVAARKDRMVLERICEIDPRGLYGGVVEHHVSMCGFVPAVAVLSAAKALGARHAEVVSYGTSGEVNGDHSSVVGYAGVVISGERPQYSGRSVFGAEMPTRDCARIVP
jgi:hypothetical protein